jgi:hypothetical protein
MWAGRCDGIANSRRRSISLPRVQATGIEPSSAIRENPAGAKQGASTAPSYTNLE